MASTGSSYVSLLSVRGGCYDVLEVWDGDEYVNVANMLSNLADLEGHIELDEDRHQTLEDEVATLKDKVATLTEEEVPKLIASSPLHSKTVVSPTRVVCSGTPTTSDRNHDPTQWVRRRHRVRSWLSRCVGFHQGMERHR